MRMFYIIHLYLNVFEIQKIDNFPKTHKFLFFFETHWLGIVSIGDTINTTMIRKFY